MRKFKLIFILALVFSLVLAFIFFAIHERSGSLRNYSLNESIGIGNIDLVRYALKQGYDVNTFNEHGSSPMHLATYSGDIEIFELLLNNGADPNMPDMRGKSQITIILEAPKSVRVEMLRLLIKHGADLSLYDSSGETTAKVLCKLDPRLCTVLGE